MNDYGYRDSYSSFDLGFHTVKATKILIIVNISVFILANIFRGAGWFSLFGMVPAFVVSRFMIWQLVTYMFLHMGLWHLVVNMLMLWFFGSVIEQSWGRRQFLTFYFFTGIGAALCSLLVSVGSTIPVVGASGAIFGILVAYAMMFPDSVILLFFFFPMKVKHAVLVLAGINLLGAISYSVSGIAYFAHLGGGLFGYLYLKNEWIKKNISYLGLSDSLSIIKDKKGLKRQASRQHLDEQADKILDKISKSGIESLTKEEKEILNRKARMR